MSNRIIVPANYSVEVIIKVDPSNGQSELMIRNRSNVQIGMMQIAGLLIEHAANVMRSLLTTGRVSFTPAIESTPCKECGIAHAGTCESSPENKVVQ